MTLIQHYQSHLNPPLTLITIVIQKPIPFPDNGNGLMIEYHRMREGPNYYMCHYKQSSVLRQDPKDAWRTLGAAKFTDTGKALKEWCLEMHQIWAVDKQKKDDENEGRKDTSFASEAIAEEEDPTANTKMVT